MALLAGAGVSANQVTIAALGLSVLWGALMLASPTPLVLAALPVVLLIRMGLNAIDGLLAREHGQQSRLGALLNELGDVLADLALYLPLAALLPMPAALFFALAAVLGVVAEMAGVLGLTIGAARRYDGPFGKSDRAVAFGLLALVIAALDPARIIDGLIGAGVAACVLALATMANRMRKALAESGDGR